MMGAHRSEFEYDGLDRRSVTTEIEVSEEAILVARVSRGVPSDSPAGDSVGQVHAEAK
ncbi:MAG: hypothetical protein AB7S38_17610 [Vulcanimicrobiota bacterium]